MNIWKKIITYLLVTGLMVFLSVTVFSEPGYLGVYFEKVTKELAKEKNLPVEYGIYITGIAKNSAADKAGLKKGDIILEIDGEEMEDESAFRDKISSTDAGETMNLKVFRDGKTLNIKATFSDDDTGYYYEYDDNSEHELPVIVEPDLEFGAFDTGSHFDNYRMESFYLSGMLLYKLDSDLAAYFKVKDGYLVINVSENSTAAKAGFKGGDVITTINNQKISSEQDFEDLIDNLKENSEMKIGIVRNGKDMALNMKYSPDQLNSITIFTNPTRLRIRAAQKAREISEKFAKEAQKKTEEVWRITTGKDVRKIIEEKKIKDEEVMRKIEKELQEKQKEMLQKQIDLQEKQKDLMKKMEEKMKELEKKLEELEKKFKEEEKRDK